ncbi:MAG TPA: prephenate dehydrogenase [Firmicutes bacterium]|nr:prephenate dehydrogenase [Bacillota bacterium]
MQPKTILIVGLGLIGGSIAKALRTFTPHRVLAMDQDPEALDLAMACGAIEGPGYVEDLPQVDVLWLCLYPQAAVEFARKYGAALREDCIVSDACGIKNAVCPQLMELSRELGFVFVGGHPMAGKERSGFEASEATLFRGASYLLVPCGAPDWAKDTMKELAMDMGFGRVVETTPEHHDEMIAYTSQLPHALACAYVLSPRCPQHKGFSAGSYRDVSRVARINETLWTELFLDNREALSRELSTLIENLSSIQFALDREDGEALRALLRKGRQVKEALGE